MALAGRCRLPLAEQRENALWEAAIRAFARLQVASVGRMAELLQVGCLDRRLETLPDQIGPLLADPHTGEVLGAADWAEPRARAPRLRAVCTGLTRLGLPPALVHGDFHAG